MFNQAVLRSVGVILLAVVVGLAIWFVIRSLGVEPIVGKGSAPHPVGAVDVAVAALVAGIGAWGVNAWLARRGLARVWPFVGSTALAISIIAPSWLADGASAVALICLHVAVALVLLLGFTLGQPERSPSIG